jgi:hypothetical protein
MAQILEQEKDYFEIIADRLPELGDSKDLVHAGLFSSEAVLWRVRQQGMGPSFIRIGGSIKYPRQWVLKWLKENTYNGNTRCLSQDKEELCSLK